MKNVFIFLVMGMISSVSLAATFTAKATETLYYYQPHTSEAAEAKMWKSAFRTCSNGDSNSNVLPIRISKVVSDRDDDIAMVTASAQFKCLDAEGREK